MRTVSIFIILVFCISCTRSKYLLHPDLYESNVMGIYVLGYQNHTEAHYRNIKGELIAIHGDTMIVRDYRAGDIRYCDRLAITSLKLLPASAIGDFNNTNQTLSAIFAFVPLSHGAYAIFTYPMNWIAFSAIAQSKHVIRYETDIFWPDLYKFARFPQGVPASVDPKELERAGI